MDLLLARSLVWDALRVAVARSRTAATDLVENEHVTLEEIGLSRPIDREYFKALLVTRIIEAGYEIDPANIPTDPGYTPIRITAELPGHSTIGNEP